MDKAEAINQLRDIREQFTTVPAIKAKWESNRTYCVAPKDVRIPLQMLVKVGLTAPTVEDAKHYLQRVEDILEWIWPTNTPQSFDLYEHGDVRVEIPAKRKPRSRAD
jgi:hypothetical protein